MDTFDYVIVGAGTAGCVLANRLSQDTNVTVCVLEAGPRDWHPYIHIPAGFIKLFYMPKLNWLYTQEPSERTGGAGGASSRRVARRSGARPRSTGTSTIAGSAATTMAGRSAATATGAMRTCCP